MSTVNAAPLAHHTPVLVHDCDGNWAGLVVHVGLFDTSPVEVAVLDPMERTDLARGQRIVVPRGDVRSLHRNRWAR